MNEPIPLNISVDVQDMPPIGLTPKKFHELLTDQKRANNIKEAVVRYFNAGMKIHIEWIEEYNELVDKINNFK